MKNNVCSFEDEVAKETGKGDFEGVVSWVNDTITCKRKTTLLSQIWILMLMSFLHNLVDDYL